MRLFLSLVKDKRPDANPSVVHTRPLLEIWPQRTLLTFNEAAFLPSHSTLFRSLPPRSASTNTESVSVSVTVVEEGKN